MRHSLALSGWPAGTDDLFAAGWVAALQGPELSTHAMQGLPFLQLSSMLPSSAAQSWRMTFRPPIKDVEGSGQSTRYEAKLAEGVQGSSQ